MKVACMCLAIPFIGVGLIALVAMGMLIVEDICEIRERRRLRKKKGKK